MDFVAVWLINDVSTAAVALVSYVLPVAISVQLRRQRRKQRVRLLLCMLQRKLVYVTSWACSLSY